jgi:hypothetical protein
MGVEYNHLGEECNSRKQYKDEKFVWVGDQKLHIHVFVWRTVLHGVFYTTKKF